jgi:hypothetical protein
MTLILAVRQEESANREHWLRVTEVELFDPILLTHTGEGAKEQ